MALNALPCCSHAITVFNWWNGRGPKKEERKSISHLREMKNTFLNSRQLVFLLRHRLHLLLAERRAAGQASQLHFRF